MSRKIKAVNRKPSRKERSQVLVIVALSAIVIIAMIGLSIDVGLLFIGNAKLRRAVDSAALAAALQYRQGVEVSALTNSADEFLTLNGFSDVTATVSTCENTPGDAELCPPVTTPPTSPRKLVRVHATADVHLAFLPVIGINVVPISATAVSEAASLDVVLVIDRSESMTYGVDLENKLPLSDPMRDPSYCNIHGPLEEGTGSDVSGCEPFKHVVDAAVAFTQEFMYFPYDNVSIVTFDKEPEMVLQLADGASSTAVVNQLHDLTVFQGENSFEGGWTGVCGAQSNPASFVLQTDRCYGDGCCMGTPDYSGGTSNYIGVYGPGQLSTSCAAYCPTNPVGDPAFYPTTNIGGGLKMAGSQLSTDSRQDVLWVVILLTDGVANSGHNDEDPVDFYCPEPTWLNYLQVPALPICNGADPVTETVPKNRHPATLADGSPNPAYDAADYAYDMADFIGKQYPYGQNALLYTIGLGPEVDNYASTYPDPVPGGFLTDTPVVGNGLGKIFLDYAAYTGRGQAYYTVNPSELNSIFRSIGTNIATRISR